MKRPGPSAPASNVQLAEPRQKSAWSAGEAGSNRWSSASFGAQREAGRGCWGVVGRGAEPGLRQWVHRDDVRAVLLGLLQRAQHPRVVGARVLPDHEDQVGFVRSSSSTLPLPMPIVCVSADPRDSWHMFEQSGRLLVPKRRTMSW